MIKELRNANIAMQLLSSKWNEASRELKDSIDKVQYPFAKSFDEVSYDFHKFCEDAEEQILNDIPLSYCFCNVDNFESFENGWLYEAKVIRDLDTVEIEESIGAGVSTNSDSITFEEFTTCFFEVPYEMAELYKKLNYEGTDTSDLYNLARKLYDFGGELL